MMTKGRVLVVRFVLSLSWEAHDGEMVVVL